MTDPTTPTAPFPDAPTADVPTSDRAAAALRFDRLSRRIAIGAGLLGLVVTGAGVAQLVRDVTAYHEVNRDRYLQPLIRPIMGDERMIAQLPPDGTNAPFPGEPVGGIGFRWREGEFRLTGFIGEDGNGTVALSWRVGDAERVVGIPIAVPVALDLPLMPRIEDWLRVMTIVEPRETDSLKTLYDDVTSGRRLDEERLVVAVRRPRAGHGAERYQVPDTLAWREAQRANWLFEFYELLPDGGIRTETLRFPDSNTKRMYQQAKAELSGVEDAAARAPDELAERSWQYFAALRVMPSGSAPKQSFEDSALTAAPWSLPMVGFGGLVMAVAGAFIVAPRRRVEDAAPPDASPSGSLP